MKISIIKPYNEKRGAEYPSIEDQLDILYHEGFDAWKAQITAIKEKYPKPAEPLI